MENSGEAADDADPDRDGVVNLLEFAFGTDPNSPVQHHVELGGGRSGLPSVEVFGEGGSGRMRIEYVRRRHSGLAYTPEFSSDLETWTIEHREMDVIWIDETWERVVVANVDLGAEVRFGRVRVDVEAP